ncbi:MAG TPA: PaaI family thioesterase [Solirubrobacteraceae bacterium]|nr:PaaI family thioesterase [Solirubrobacteraceae bacterium]
MTEDQSQPEGFEPVSGAGAFVDLVGPVYADGNGTLGVRIEERHLNVAGTAMGGFLATLVDIALGNAIREDADGEPGVATVSLTMDYLKPAPAGAWVTAETTVERLGGSLAFVDCALNADGENVVRARAVFAVRGD